ncbi:MAG: 3-keto-5-aminohexanoate cleavage protein [Alphaproteobacteria bacterium]|jgi:uncharacterized protein (DUF849 family)|nr:3-keto-5-aminohexanoate cleavage protein [Alphaproteobacteria bacterium]
MNNDVIVTCAVTGSGDTAGKHPDLPITPEQIANAALEAREAGAAVAHIHVRDPETGQGSRDVELYREVVERIRDAGSDVIINLTSGMGGDLMVNADDPAKQDPGTDLVDGLTRLAHVEALRPDICTLDCGSMNFGEGNSVVINTPHVLRVMAKRVLELGVKPEMEVFDTGQLWFAKTMYEEGLVADPPMYQICLGIPYGAPADTAHMKAMADAMPPGAVWAGFGISRMQMPMVAQAVLLGGHVRVGLEDNLYLERGVHASNGQLVEKAIRIVRDMGARTLDPTEARKLLKITQ